MKISRSKYHAKKTEVDGIVFDSKKEACRYVELKILEESGLIRNLKRQQKFVLIPSQKIDGRVIERECAYKADFTYEGLTENGWVFVVEDTKGVRTPDYIIKRKLMLERHGIRILEV